MPSPSLSGSGQPSSSWKPSRSSGSLGHLSLRVGDAVAVVVGVGAAVVVLEAVLVLGLVAGTDPDASGMPSPSLSCPPLRARFGVRRGAQVTPTNTRKSSWRQAPAKMSAPPPTDEHESLVGKNCRPPSTSAVRSVARAGGTASGSKP